MAIHCIPFHAIPLGLDRKSTRLNSSHLVISYAVFCLKKKKLNTLASGSALSYYSGDNLYLARTALDCFRAARDDLGSIYSVRVGGTVPMCGRTRRRGP